MLNKGSKCGGGDFRKPCQDLTKNGYGWAERPLCPFTQCMSSNHSQHPSIFVTPQDDCSTFFTQTPGLVKSPDLDLSSYEPQDTTRKLSQSHERIPPWVRSTKNLLQSFIILFACIIQLEKRPQGYVQYRSEDGERIMFAYSTDNVLLLLLRPTLQASNHSLKTLQRDRLNPLFVCLPPLSCPTSSPLHCLQV